MAEILELYGVEENLELLIDEIVFNDTININQESILVELIQDEIVYTENSNLHQNKIEVELLVDEIIYPDAVNLNGIQVPTDPHIHFFGSETLSEIASGVGLRDNGDRVEINPWAQASITDCIGSVSVFDFWALKTLAQTNPLVVLTEVGAAITWVKIPSIFIEIML